MVTAPRRRSPEFLRRAGNRPALRRRSSLVVAAQLLLVASGLGVGGALAYFGHQYVQENQTFRLRRLLLDSVPEHLQDPVRQQLASAEHSNLLLLDLEQLQQQLETLPQVAEAHVRRLLPDAVEVEVRAHEPFALLEAADTSLLVSREGVVLGAATRPDPGLPRLLLRGSLAGRLDETWRLPDDVPGATSLPAAVTVIEWLRAGRDKAFGELTALRLEADGVVAVIEGAPWVLALGDGKDLAAKAANLGTLLRSEPPREPCIIDLRYRDMVVVRPHADPDTSGKE